MDMYKTAVMTTLVAVIMVVALTFLPLLFGKENSIETSAIVYSKKCVIIDAGHGGFDGGAVADDGTLEKDLNLSIALKTADILRSAGFDVILTRETDSGLEAEGDTTIRQKKITDMKTRLKIMEDNPEAIFVSVHLNKYTAASPKGTQVFYAPKAEGSYELAESIQSSAISMLQPENHRKVKKAGKDTMLLYRAPIPAVIVECGFLSNPQELERLKDEEYQSEMAFSIAVGIIKYTECETYGTEN